MIRDTTEIEQRQQVGGGGRLGLRQPTARPGEQANQGFGSNPGGPEGTQTGVAMSLGQAATIGTDHQRDVSEARRLKLQRVVEQQLPRCGGDQIVAANDFRHPGIGIVNDDGELIGGTAGRLPHDEITTHLRQVDGHRPTICVDEVRRMADTEAPGKRSIQGVGIGGVPMSANAGICRPFMLPMWGTGGGGDVRSSAGARINEFLGAELSQGGFIEWQPPGLHDRFAVPIQTEPTQIIQGLLGRPRFDAGGVDVLDAEQQSPPGLSRCQPGDQVSSGIADVLGPGGRRSQSTDISGPGRWETHG